MTNLSFLKAALLRWCESYTMARPRGRVVTQLVHSFIVFSEIAQFWRVCDHAYAPYSCQRS